MKPLWCVTITLDMTVPVVAETQDEAEYLARAFIHSGDFLIENADLSTVTNKVSTLKFLSLSETDLPLGTEDDPELESLDAKEYLAKYIEWKTEEDKRVDLEKKQGKLF